MSQTAGSSSSVPTPIPDDYFLPTPLTRASNADGSETFLIPKFMLPVIRQYFDNQPLPPKADDILESINPGPRPHSAAAYEILGAGNKSIMLPPDPPLSGREALQLHKEVVALMERENLTYQAAARLLYFAEVSKLEAQAIALHAFKDIVVEVNGEFQNE